MNQYQVTRVSGKPDWNNIPAAPIANRLWSDVDGITPSAQLAWDDNTLYVRLQTQEENILRRFTGNMDPVCQDSCLEFFFCPEGAERYLNFEVNPNGSLYLGYGKQGAERCRLFRNNFKDIFQITPFDIPGGWGVELQIPVSFIQIYVPEFSFRSGLSIRGNFFKCGDDTVAPHYMSWNPVGSSVPNFHLPEYFGQLIFE